MTLRLLRTLLAGLTAMVVTACGGPNNFTFVTPQEKAAIAQIRSGSHELVAVGELAPLRDVGRYERFQSGTRTWLLDTATGAICILLTTDQDWKDPKTDASNCAKQPPSR
jgi:hypothetical protein